MNDQIYDDEEEERQRVRRMRHRAEMKRKKRAQERLRRRMRRLSIMAVIAIIVLLLLIGGIRLLVGTIQKNRAERQQVQETELENISTGAGMAEGDMEEQTEEPTEEVGDVLGEEGLGVSTGAVAQATESDSTRQIGEDIPSEYAVLIDVENHSILAEKAAHTVINPASMTKILTLLVAAEHVTDLHDTFTMTIDITDYTYSNDCSTVGFAEGEKVPVRDLFYGTILPSGGDAALGLASYVSGSQEEFVKLMNDKLTELGLSDTAHFTNCIGIYDENHHCTVYDMAIIMEAAMENPFCRKVLSAHTYTTSSTPEHPEGITISNWFLRRIEDKDAGLTVEAGKTGYVLQSGNCAASYGESADGKGYVCVTGDAYSGWRCIYDHVAIYSTYAKAQG
ncbi:MAG: D-alanyl-D-alanine carboxypeptidase [Lachnospiraceae bacterium]|nr:D-alanyl-D-alanine carboxypeptidase [Lachnospiraceae bacterium]